MKQITDSERIAACKVLGVCSAVDESGAVTLSRESLFMRPQRRYWSIRADAEGMTPDTIVTDCPDWRKSARDERGEVVG